MARPRCVLYSFEVKTRHSLLPLLVLALLGTTLVPAAAHASRREKREEQEKIAQLPPKYQQWLAETELLLNDSERATFLDLGEDYQRDAFIQSFWKSRDPYPETARNELQDQWQARIDEARSLFGDDLREERARMLLLNGPPTARIEIGCGSYVWPAEVWFYDRGNRSRE